MIKNRFRGWRLGLVGGMTVAVAALAQDGAGLTGEYYGDKEFKELKLTRIDPEVNFDWKNGAPDPALPEDGFSIRWTGQVAPAYSEQYTFYVRADDGCRLWVNGQLILEDWRRKPASEAKGSIELKAGARYDIRLEYLEEISVASVQLSWSSPSQPKEIIPQGRLFPVRLASPAPPLEETPDLSALPAGSVRYAHGAPVAGTPTRIAAEGLEIQTPRGPQTIPWAQLALGTRYRLQPGFRDALPKILKGEAVEAREQPPAPEAAPASTSASPAPAAPSAASAPAPTPPAAPKPAAATPKPAATAAKNTFPENTFPAPAKTLIYALTFTDNPADTVAVGINLGDQGRLPENMVYWWPYRQPTPAPEWVKNSRAGPGNFPPLQWSGTREGHDVEIELIPLFRGGHGKTTAQGLMTLTARKGGARARYLLRHTEIPAGPDTAPLKISTPFAAPIITLRITGGGQQLYAAIKVGGWDILPLSGVENNLNVEVFDAKGRSVEKGRVKTDEETFKSKTEPWQHEFKRMKGGETYTIKASINLGSLFGEAKAEQSVQAVDLKF